MATPKQIAANRKNAQKSTGPKSDEGKERTRWNALKHGLASTHTILPHEDPIEFHQIRAELIDTYKPANAIELMLVDEVAKGHWRMQRSHRFEAALFQSQLRILKHQHDLDPGPSALDDEAIAVTMLKPSTESGYRTYYRYDARAQTTFYRSLDRLEKLTAARRRHCPAQPQLAEEHTSKLASFGARDAASAISRIASLAILLCLLTAAALFAVAPSRPRLPESSTAPRQSTCLHSVFDKMQGNHQPQWGHSAGAIGAPMYAQPDC